MERHKFISKLIAYIAIALFFLAIFFDVYAPVIQKNFFYEQDKAYLGPQGEPVKMMNIALKEGRILNAYYLYYLGSYVKSSNSTKKVRYVGVIGIALFASVMWAVFKRFRFRSDHAFLMSALICTLPAMQFSFLYLNCISYIYSAWLASLSALIMFNVIYNEETKGRTYKITGVLTSIILMVASHSLYQSNAMMYWAIGVIFCLTGDNHDFFKKYQRPLVKYFLVGLISMAIYYIVFMKIVPHAMNISMDERTSFVPFNMIPMKFAKFIFIHLKHALNLWNVYPAFTFAIFISAIILYGIRLNLLPEIKEEKQLLASSFLQKYYVIFILLILSNLPSLIVPETAFYYRTLLPFGTALTVLFCFALFNIVEFPRFLPNFSAGSRKTIITALLTVLFIVTALLARYNAVHWFSPAQLDVNIWEMYGY